MVAQCEPESSFRSFVEEVEPGLRRALVGHTSTGDVQDALGEAFAYAWQHWSEVRALDNPAGYLFRVAQSSTRRRRQGFPPAPDYVTLPDMEPRLWPAMRRLSRQQRSVTWLVHGCGWSYGETAEALGMSASTVGTHLSRAMEKLRAELGAER